MQSRLPELFGMFPKAPLTVEAVPASQPNYPTHYIFGTPDGTRPARADLRICFRAELRFRKGRPAKTGAHRPLSQPANTLSPIKPGASFGLTHLPANSADNCAIA